MSGAAKSRWADSEEDAALENQRKREKEEKKRAKAEKQRKLDAAEASRRPSALLPPPSSTADQPTDAPLRHAPAHEERPPKRRRLSPSEADRSEHGAVPSSPPPPPPPLPTKLLRFPAPEWGPCRHVDNFEKLNHIEEGSYGWVSRARERATGEVVALKKLKMDAAAGDGFPVTGLREIQTLMACRHVHVVDLREVVMGDGMSDVFLVMPFLEHDLKTLQEDMPEPFLPSETKALLRQLASAVAYLHAHWILHRDLKTSNLLLNNRGRLQVADFGMARYTSEPAPPKLTQLVVTLWYRAPELLLGAETYGFGVDMWSVGCIFAELLTREPLLQGKNEVDQLAKIFSTLGLPTAQSWPTFRTLPNARALRLPPSSTTATNKQQPPTAALLLRTKFPFLTTAGTSLLGSLLALNPERRPSAADLLAHAYFTEDPKPKSTAMFPTFPSKAGQEKTRRQRSPNAPMRGDAPKMGEGDVVGIFAGAGERGGGGFSLRMG